MFFNNLSEMRQHYLKFQEDSFNLLYSTTERIAKEKQIPKGEVLYNQPELPLQVAACTYLSDYGSALVIGADPNNNDSTKIVSPFTICCAMPLLALTCDSLRTDWAKLTPKTIEEYRSVEPDVINLIDETIQISAAFFVIYDVHDCIHRNGILSQAFSDPVIAMMWESVFFCPTYNELVTAFSKLMNLLDSKKDVVSMAQGSIIQSLWNEGTASTEFGVPWFLDNKLRETKDAILNGTYTTTPTDPALDTDSEVITPEVIEIIEEPEIEEVPYPHSVFGPFAN
jgi:hypothetical protein